MAVAWAKRVPDAVTPLTTVPLEYDQFCEQNLPVHKEVVITASGGVAVSLPVAFQSEISSANEYRVRHSKQTFLSSGGEIYVSDKTTTGFKIQNSGSAYGEEVFVEVIWMPA